MAISQQERVREAGRPQGNSADALGRRTGSTSTEGVDTLRKVRFGTKETGQGFTCWPPLPDGASSHMEWSCKRPRERGEKGVGGGGGGEGISRLTRQTRN